MRTSNKSIDVEKMCKNINNGSICFDMDIQRAVGQWSIEQQSLLIDTLIRGYKMPAIWVTSTQTELYAKNTIIDGSQRLHTIYDYVNDRFKLHKSIEPVVIEATEENELDEDITVELAGKKFSKLPKIIQNIIMDFDVDEIVMYDYSDEQIEKQFSRLNNGALFTKAQKATVNLGSDTARKVHAIEEMDFWNKTSFSKAQRKHAEITSCILQSFMIINDEDYANFGANSVEEYARKFAQTASDEDFVLMENLVTALDECIPDTEEANKFMKKLNIPTLLQCTKTFLDYKAKNMITDEQFTEFLSDFIDTGAECSGYLENCGTGSQSRTKVENRVKILNDWFIEYIKRINHIEGIDDIISEEEKDIEDEIRIGTYGEEGA